MQISKAIVGAGVNLSVCRSDIFNHRCKLQSGAFENCLSISRLCRVRIPAYRPSAYVSQEKWQTALQGEKKTRHNKSGQSYLHAELREERLSRI
jgi:hypothetical protein